MLVEKRIIRRKLNKRFFIKTTTFFIIGFILGFISDTHFSINNLFDFNISGLFLGLIMAFLFVFLSFLGYVENLQNREYRLKELKELHSLWMNGKDVNRKAL